MRNALVLALVVLALVIASSEAGAAGPFCLSTDPFADVFVWFLSSTGGNQFAGSGRDLSGDRAQTVSGYVSGNVATVGYTTYPSTPDTVPVTGGGTIDLATGRGPGSCVGPDLASCGSFTFASIACPPGAVSDSAGDARLPAGRVQGMAP